MMQKVFTLIGAILLTMGVNAQATLKVEPFKIGIGEQKTITLDMDNSGLTDAAAFCCDIYLPEGVEIETDSEGNYNFSISTKDGRSTSPESLIIASAIQSDEAVRVICFPTDASAFAGVSGAILNIPLVASKDLPKGTEEVTIANQEITNTTGLSTFNPDASISDLIAFIRSDANSDGDINITDVAYVLDDINGASTEGFDEDAADANRDGEINITDVSLILDIINSEN